MSTLTMDGYMGMLKSVEAILPKDHQHVIYSEYLDPKSVFLITRAGGTCPGKACDFGFAMLATRFYSVCDDRGIEAAIAEALLAVLANRVDRTVQNV